MERPDTPLSSPRLCSAIGETCRTARLELGLTQEDVAERVGIATEVYGRLERGKMTPSVPTLRKLCLVLNVSADVALSIDPTAERPVRLEGSFAIHEESTPPEHRRLVRRAQRLSPKAVRLLGILAAFLAKASRS